jgi:tRNA uridine 5-carboxymethylaminomethyl modification enzyme
LDFWQDMVSSIIVEDNQAVGVITQMGIKISSKAVIVTSGTFLNGVIHIGEKKFGGGRMGEKSAHGITEQLVSLGFESGRMKTGTPPRLDGRSLDYSKMEIQPGDDVITEKFSFSDETKPLTHQLPCYIAYTSENVHDILKTGFEKSPMFSGRIQGLGPRYCPSIEDKVTRFAERDRHQLFVEPEGWQTCEIYLNGFSTSLPQDVQYKALTSIAGFENVKMFRPGYAIEYDYFPPTQLKLTLETKIISNLYFAGQINGTTGYEEAACQGLMAGINAHQKINEQSDVVLSRSEAYIGVLIDDLINKGTDEPYRMFTSRAEYRILLRQDNADIRLTGIGHKIGLASNESFERVNQKILDIKSITKFFAKTGEKDLINQCLVDIESNPVDQRTWYNTILTRPFMNIGIMRKHIPEIDNFLLPYSTETIEEAEIQMKYEGYILKEHELVEKMLRLENIRINDNFDYSTLSSLTIEAREKLSKIKPTSIGQASRISGVSPSDVSVLLVHLGR